MAVGTAGGPGASPRVRAGRVSRVTVLPGPVSVPTQTGRPTDEPLMADLRAWRLAHARADEVPAYRVAADTVLAEIVMERPASIAALRRVKGIGPDKLERYGEEILAIVARH